jgi:endo-1,4-beta-xylanase
MVAFRCQSAELTNMSNPQGSGIRKLALQNCAFCAFLLAVNCTAEIEGSGDPVASPYVGGQAAGPMPSGAGGVHNPATGGQVGTAVGGRPSPSAGGTGGAPTGGRSVAGGGSTGGVQQSTGGVSTGTATGGKGSATGGSPATGGAPTGGRSSGFPGAGGKAAGGTSSGGSATGGVASGTGGAGSGVPASNCTESNRSLTGNGTGKHCGYTYEYWKDSGTGTLNLTPDGFNVDWSNINNLLGRKGIRPGTDALVVTYEANYQPNGNSYLTVYGWTTNPLVEYYIVDSWGNWRPPGGEGSVGATVMSDGGTYDLYKIPRNGANIQGNGAFTQYWSVRKEKKTSGAITVANHFNAWKSNGMPMGSLYEVSLSVEGYQSAGKAEVKFSIK